MSFYAKLLDRQHGMKLDAAPRSTDLKMTEIEEPDAGDADADPSKLVPRTSSSFHQEVLEHVHGEREPVLIRRFGAAARIRIGQFHDDVQIRSVRIVKNDVNIVVRRALHPANCSDDPVDLEFLLADAVIPGRTTVRGKIVQRGDARVDRGVDPNALGVRVAKTLHAAAGNSAARRERNDGEHRCCATPERFGLPVGGIASRRRVSEHRTRY